MATARVSFLVVFLTGCAGPAAPDQLAPAEDGHSPGGTVALGVEPNTAASPTWSVAAQENIAAGEYAPQPEGDGFRATNRAQDLHATFGPRGLTVSGRSGAGEVGLSLRAWGREEGVTAADAVAPEEGACLSDGAADAFGSCLRRVDYARPGVTEWWENRPEGLEQGFTVTAPPDGDGALVFELGLTGALADVEGDEALLVRESGDPLRLGGLAAWDATGRSLPAWMEEIDGGLRILVDDSGAIGAVTVDPLLTTASWMAESDQANAHFGWSVASAGDVNGDGFGDVVVGAHFYESTLNNQGRAFVYLGSVAGLGTTAAWTAESDQTESRYGYSVASAGDVNGDGYGDIVVGAYAYDNGQTNEGRAFVYLGSASGPASTPAWTKESDNEEANFGFSVASAGDVNGDGYGDVAVGALLHTSGGVPGGRADVFLGSASGLATTAAWFGESGQSLAYYGYVVASAGDVNGDGYGDLAVGAYSYDNGSSNEGRAYLYLGAASGLATGAAWTAESNQDGGQLGLSLGSAGDVNGDGYGDLVVGAYLYDNGQPDEGRALVYLGSASGLATSAAWTAEPDQAGAGFGTSVASAGDVNGDGYGDVVIGAPNYDGGATDEGRTYLYFGSAAGLQGTSVSTLLGGQAGASFGFAVAGAGDVNGDGYGDVIAGAYLYDNGSTNEGRVGIYMGAASGVATSAGWTAESDQYFARFGYSVSSAGDVNGDGYGDVVVGAPSYSSLGRAYAYLGSSSGLSTSAAWTVVGGQVSANLGTSVASAGDVNGDGYGDVIVGAPGYTNGQSAEGQATVYLGSASGLTTTASWALESNVANRQLGTTLASVGDVNGDGYGDVGVENSVYLGSASGLASSSVWTEPVSCTSCKVRSAGDVNGDGYGDALAGPYLYLGAPGGLATSSAWVAQWTGGGNSGDASNYLLASASAGDVNGDGYGDVLVGLPGYDNGEVDEGRAYLYLGSASGLGTIAVWSAEADQIWSSFGLSVASAGDLNGDGYGDVVIGAPGFDRTDIGWPSVGRAYVYLGSASGLGSGAAWTTTYTQLYGEYGRSAGSAGDVNGDGYGDLLVGKGGNNGSSSLEGGRAYIYMGNGADGTGLGLSRAAQARRPGLTTPITPGLTSTSTSAFDVSMANARGPWGRAKVKLQIETKPLGTAFNGTGLTTSSSFTSAGLTGASLQQAVSGLTTATGYHWRARVLASPAEGRPQGWGAWVVGGLSGSALGGHVYTVGATYYADTDGDGYGTASVTASLRGPTTGWASDATDCNDASALVHPGAAETCNGIDDNCDGSIDPWQSVGATNWHADSDDDGYGVTNLGQIACTAPANHVADNTDCDDGSAAVHPGASETCNGIDDNCDGVTDPATSVDAISWHHDADADGYGDLYTSVSACTAPSGWLADASDCNDADDIVHPGAAEFCDGFDNDCDGSVDPTTSVDAYTWYTDADHDGYGNPALAVMSCVEPAYASLNDGDCDDTNAAISPDGVEACNGIDDDCNTLTDEAGATGEATWYWDSDADGYGNPTSSVSACDVPSSYVADATDCDDGAVAVHPGATEACNHVDDDCDATTDETGSTGETTFFVDADFDTYGDPARTVVTCWEGAGAAADDDDCDDTLATVNPAALEYCNEADDDCNGITDDPTAEDAVVYYRDVDGDGFGGKRRPVLTCEQPSGFSPYSTDCRDNDATVNPGAPEACDGVDDDCDAVVDEPGATIQPAWYTDTDTDGYGTGAPTYACIAPPGLDDDALDCNDAVATVHPGAIEVCDTLDNNCDGFVDPSTAVDAATWHPDADGDSYGATGGATTACTVPSGYLANATDCDDAVAAVHPGAPEVCNSVDDDCDGDVDPSTSVGAPTWHADADNDGYGASSVGTPACTAPAGYLADAFDCDDSAAAVHPGAAESCNSIDDNCDGIVDPSTSIDAATWHADADSDGYGATGPGTPACVAPSGHLADATDCDDAAIGVHPGAPELCNSLDDDCDSSIDPATSHDAPVWYTDADGDNYGASAGPLSSCTALAGRVNNGDDCDDLVATTYPGAPERCDGERNDCTIDPWSSAAEDGQVWFESDTGVWTAYTTPFTAGGYGAPTPLTLPVGGTMWVCDGTYAVRLTASAAGSSAVVGLYDGAVLSAGGVGSVVAVTGASANVTLTGLTLQDGVGSGAPTRGGAVRVTAGTVNVNDCLLQDNTATQGGGLSVVGGTVTVASSVIAGNTATSGGGWYQSGGTLAMNNTVVELNGATDGAGGYYATGAFTNTGLSLLDNTASTSGGGLRANNAMTLTSAIVLGNDATNGGGLYYGGAGGTLALTSTLVDQNVASGYGGGVYQAGGTLSCTGSTAGTYGFTTNTATTGGGGVYLPLTTSVFVTTLCDFGATVGTNNSPSDVLYGTTAYNKNNDVTMICRTGTCR